MRLIFRIVMLLANVVGLIVIMIAATISAGHGDRGPFNNWQDGLITLTVFSGIVGNVVYIILYPRRGENARKSRIGTLIGLWFDAKERELRDRAVKS